MGYVTLHNGVLYPEIERLPEESSGGNRLFRTRRAHD
jgi:hypothetical protein